LDLGIVGAILAIIAIDLVLSGDNAVVIGMAARRLPAHQRRKAIVWGGAGAIILRIIFTILAALLLDVPLLQAIGGVLLLYIAIKLLKPVDDSHTSVKEADTMGQAIRTIILADAVMSLDNMLAVGGAAHGHLWLLLFGLALSIPILLVGSNIISHLIGTYPWLNYVGAAVLVYTAMEMIFGDEILHDYVEVSLVVEYAIILAVVAAVTLTGIVLNRRAHTEHLDPAGRAHDEDDEPEAELAGSVERGGARDRDRDRERTFPASSSSTSVPRPEA
jgi:YjbE family integral membrane protein